MIRGEINRQLIHICGGSLVPVAYYFFSRKLITLGFITAFLIIAAIELARYKGYISLPFLRSYEESDIGAYVYFAIGAFIAILLFSKTVAITSILMLSIGDGVTGMFSFGESKPVRSVLIMFIVCTLIGLFFLTLPIALLGAVCATLADLQTRIDDNLLIPVISGTAMSIMHV